MENNRALEPSLILEMKHVRRKSGTVSARTEETDSVPSKALNWTLWVCLQKGLVGLVFLRSFLRFSHSLGPTGVLWSSEESGNALQRVHSSIPVWCATASASVWPESPPVHGRGLGVVQSWQDRTRGLIFFLL